MWSVEYRLNILVTPDLAVFLYFIVVLKGIIEATTQQFDLVRVIGIGRVELSNLNSISAVRTPKFLLKNSIL